MTEERELPPSARHGRATCRWAVRRRRGARAAVRRSLRAGLREIDRAFEARLRLARERGEAFREGDPATLARMASASLHWLAIRAREPRAALEQAAEDAVALLCG